MQTQLNVSRAAYIWKRAFYVAHLEKSEDFLGTQVAIIKSQPEKHGQYLKFARKQELNYLFGVWDIKAFNNRSPLFLP